MRLCTPAIAPFLAMFLLIDGAARAAPPSGRTSEEAQSLINRAKAACDASAYGRCAELLAEAFARVPDPRVLYHHARTLRRADQPAEALRQFRAFVERFPDDPLRSKAQQQIEELTAEASALTQAPPPPPPPPACPPGLALVPGQPGRCQQKAPLPPTPPRRPPWRVALGVGIGVVGAGLVGLGAWALAKNGMAGPPTASGDQSMAPLSDTATYHTLSPGIGLVTAGGAVVLGGVLLAALPGAQADRRVP